MHKMTRKITELEQSKAFLEDAEKNLNASLNNLRNQGKQGTQVYREQKKRYLKTIKTLVDIRRFFKQWDKMHLEHV
jgi:hypothetical protein